jgi:hypothetical protein
VFRGNNLRRNRYPVKMGWEQRDDLAFPGNFWDDRGEAEVLASVLDGRKDPALGTVTLTPMLPEPRPVRVPPFSAPSAPGWR